MNFDVSWYGYGAGLVMVGWFAGLVVSYFFSALGGVR